VIEALRPLTSTSGTPVVQRRATMQMPRVRLPRPGAGEAGLAPGLAPEPAPAARPAAPKPPVQPLPPRAPSSLQSAPPAPARPLVRSAPAPVETPYQEQGDDDPAATELPVPSGRAMAQPAPQRGGQLGTIAIVLIAVIAGVAAFFVSKMLF